MNSWRVAGIAFLGAGALFVGISSSAQEATPAVTFKADIKPIIKKYCLPCHAEDNYNPSELSLDSYQLLMEGGKHGSPVVPGKPDESLLIKKLSGTADFGDQMPLAKKRNDGEVKQTHLTAQEMKTLREWIAQGAKEK
ncbi:MAG: c-type cytochrome domain-containing protein [Bacteroidota bacterium]